MPRPALARSLRRLFTSRRFLTLPVASGGKLYSFYKL